MKEITDLSALMEACMIYTWTHILIEACMIYTRTHILIEACTCIWTTILTIMSGKDLLVYAQSFNQLKIIKIKVKFYIAKCPVHLTA